METLFCVTIIIAPVKRGTLNIKPKAHIRGSAVGKHFTIFCDKIDPKGTPIIPAIIVIAPNLNDTLIYQNFENDIERE